MKKILTMLLLGSMSLGMMAQSDTDAKAQINKIKRSQSYLSAEATMATEEEAKSVAMELLVGEINDWVSTRRKGGEVKQVVLQDINTNAQQMDMKRGTRTRVFVYVKKKDIVLIYGEGQLVLNDEELLPLASLGSTTETAVSQEEKVVRGLDGVPAEVLEAEDKAPQPQVETEPQPVVEEVAPLQRVLAAKSMAEMKPVFAALKAEGRITYGVYKSGEVADNCYLLFYDRTGVIKRVVRKAGETLTDAASGAAVELSSLSGMGAYWFILN